MSDNYNGHKELGVVVVSERDRYKFKILWNLMHNRPRRWGSSYTQIENVASGLPRDEMEACLDVANQLVKEGFLIPHKKWKCVSLNIRRIKEINEFLDSVIE